MRKATFSSSAVKNRRDGVDQVHDKVKGQSAVVCTVRTARTISSAVSDRSGQGI